MFNMFCRIWLVLFLSVFVACSSTGSGNTDEDDDNDDETLTLADVNDYAYWLQAIDLAELEASAYDLIVMDYATDGADENAFTAQEIADLKDSAGGPKILLAYLSIGEAEDYRFYWEADFEEDNPAFIGPENPDFEGNYKVRFWEDDWQEIIFEYLDRILAQGFDGVYLDIIDAFEFWGSADIGGNDERPTAPTDMVEFVQAIAARARASNPDFLIFPQNGTEIINEVDADTKQEYFDTIDGIGAEDTFFPGDDSDNPALNVQDDAVANLGEFVDRGKIVIAIDYVQEAGRIDEFYELALAEGYIPYASTRDLDTLTVNAGHEPD